MAQLGSTGFVTDTLSGVQGANALHADASKRNVAAGMAMYAVYDEATNKLYVLQPQATGDAYVGQRVTVTGTLGPSAMQHAGQQVNPQTSAVEDFHHVGQDSMTPIGGVLTISSIAPAQPAQVSVTGFVTDTLAGFHGADEKHVDAAKRNVKAGMAKYAVFDEQTKKLYILEPQDTAAANVGQRVTVTGVLAPSAMQHAGQIVDPATHEVKDFHRVVNDSTPIGGVLTITSIAAAPVPTATGN